MNIMIGGDHLVTPHSDGLSEDLGLTHPTGIFTKALMMVNITKGWGSHEIYTAVLLLLSDSFKKFVPKGQAT